MGVENVYDCNDNVPSADRKPIKQGVYFCIECNKQQEVDNSGILRHCPKCGSSQFYQQ